MNSFSQIVAGGGWKGTRVEKVKVKAWSTLFGAVLLGTISALGADSIWFYAFVPAGLAFLIAMILFLRERPRAIEFPSGRAGSDPRKL